MDWLERKPFTTLFVDGNHENFDVLDDLPREDWSGGQVQRIRPHVLHLCRSHLFHLDGKLLFVLGGAQSHDAKVLLSDSPQSAQERRALRQRSIPIRVEGESWWRQELPDCAQLRQAWDCLAWEDWGADEGIFVLTHCAPTELQQRLFPEYPTNALTDVLSLIRSRLNCCGWYCGHYHQDICLAQERFHVLNEAIIPLE